MATSRFIKTKADFTLRKKSQIFGDGTVYETDYATTTRPNFEWLTDKESGSFVDSNFVFTIRANDNGKKRHRRSIENKDWTAEDENRIKTRESKIGLKLNYNSLKDFAYFGSAVDMVKASINDIIMRFPGELYFTTTQQTVGSTTYYVVDNDLEIDLELLTIPSDSIVSEDRYFLSNYYNYNLIGTDGIGCCIPEVTVVSREKENCELDKGGRITTTIKVAKDNISGTTNVYTYFYLYVYTKGSNKTILYQDSTLAGACLRPNEDIIEDFFDSLDDFERTLLPRNTNPKYRAIFDKPIEKDDGLHINSESYIWPVKNGWNLRTEGAAFNVYLQSLLDLAEYYDENDTDNLWRRMTHQAIKNLDWTFIRKDNSGNITDETAIDNSKIEAICKLYGRQYDDIKHYIDTIKYANIVSYDDKCSVPDYLLTDMVRNKGWQVTMLNPTYNDNIKSPILFSSTTIGYSSTDANVAFLKELSLNSSYLESKKGTKEGLEAMLGLLGFKENEYTINEYICVASGNPTEYKEAHDALFSGTPYESGTGINYPLYSDINTINENRDDFYSCYYIPCKDVTFSRTVNGSAITASYMVPWFSKDITYEGDFYFQCKGGWGKTDKKYINTTMAPNLSAITSDSALTIYEESVSSLKFIGALDNLKYISQNELKNGLICYVTDTTTMSKYYTPKSDEATTDYSHYFVLIDKNYSTLLGYNSNIGTYGWKNVHESEILSGTGDGKKVLYLELMLEKEEGNNPHNGNDSYDNGQEYLDRMASPFKYAIENDYFTEYNSTEKSAITKYKYTMVEQADNVKSWFFTDIFNRNDKLVTIKKDDNGNYVYSGANEINIVSGGTKRNGLRDSEINTFNPEVGTESRRESDEAAANSIINTKRLTLVFNLDAEKYSSTGLIKTEQYIKDKVLPYITQMIPSTTIFEYKITNE